jgi:hypothetical protein
MSTAGHATMVGPVISAWPAVKGLPGSILGTAFLVKVRIFLVIALGDVGLAATLMSGSPYHTTSQEPEKLRVRLAQGG